MDQTAIQPGLPPAKIMETGIKAGPAPADQPMHPVRQALEYLADLRLTVILFALSMLIVFWGTLAQTDAGVWTVVSRYFRCWIAWVSLKPIFFNLIDNTKDAIPFPGGWLIGAVMFVNLLAAHAIRFKFTLARSGIFLIHAGIIVMMVGEVITGVYQVEGNMIIKVGETTKSVVHPVYAELAVVQTIDASKDDVVVVPASRLKSPGALVEHADLPFKIEVIDYMVNSRLLDNKKIDEKMQGFGRHHVADRQDEVSGVDPEQKFDYPSVYVQLQTRGGKELGRWLFSTKFADPQWIEIEGKKYQVSLRFKQTQRDYTFHLKQFDHKVFPGEPNKPKDYRSHIHISDPTTGVERDVEIYMNNPLYYRGETFYQSGMQTDMRGNFITTLQVVRNPGWLLPYLSCLIVGVGMLVHFGITLYRFIDRRVSR